MLTGFGQFTDCNNVGHTPFDAIPSTWSSDNSTIASLTPGTDADDVTVNYVGGGTTNVWGNNFGPGYDYHLNAFCRCILRNDYYTSAFAIVTGLAPASLSIFSNDSTPPEASCGLTGGGTGCGVSRSFKYQVIDQFGHPLQVGGYNIWDAFAMPSPDGLNMGSRFVTTCLPANTGPCGVQTDGNGQFDEMALSVCAGACHPSNVCTLGGGAYSQVTQTWHVGPSSINQTIRYYCDHVTVNGS